MKVMCWKCIAFSISCIELMVWGTKSTRISGYGIVVHFNDPLFLLSKLESLSLPWFELDVKKEGKELKEPIPYVPYVPFVPSNV